MGVFSAISKMFGGGGTSKPANAEVKVIKDWSGDQTKPGGSGASQSPAAGSDPSPAATTSSASPSVLTADADGMREQLAQSRPDAAVQVANRAQEEIDVIERESSSNSSGAISNSSAQAPRSKQELLAELSKSYTEVVALVRKVDDHLDKADRRSERLMEIAEKLPTAIDTLGSMKDQHSEMNDTLRALNDSIRDGHSQSDKGVAKQLQSLERVQELLEKSGDAEREMGQSIVEFKESVSDMAGSNVRLGEVLDTIQKRDSMRDTRLQEMVERTQRWMFVLILVVAVVAVAVVASVIAFSR